MKSVTCDLGYGGLGSHTWRRKESEMRETFTSVYDNLFLSSLHNYVILYPKH